MNSRKLSFGLAAATMLAATPVMAQQVNREPGVTGFNHSSSRYLTGGYGVRATPGPGHHYGNRFHPTRRAGALATAPRDATAPWDGDSYASGSYGLVERQW
jgi:hypothetical protein